MRRPALLLAACMLVALSPVARAQRATMYIYGGFCSQCNAPNAVNQLYDDGAHDDGAAGDGVFGAVITVDKPAGHYGWWADIDFPGMGGGLPYCGCAIPPMVTANLWTSGPGDVIHFRRSDNPPEAGWGGQEISAGSHGIPPGAQLEVAFPGMYDNPPGPGYPATFVDGYWQVIVTAPNSTMMMFRTTDQLVRYTDTYNCWCSCSPGEQRFVWFTITNPNSDFLFQFDPVSGRMRGVELGPTAAGRSTWGKLRTHYR